MGMFDYIRCLHPSALIGDVQYQTKDTPAQLLDLYEIRADGTLWHEEYDTEDHSDPNAEGFMRIFGSMAKVNQRFVFEAFDGVIDFYGGWPERWIEYRALFNKGHLVRDIDLTVDRPSAKSIAAL